MPLYEYKCHGCGKKFEVIQKFADEPLKTHPECGGDVERLISAPTLQFKGSGWYVTDYGKNNSPAQSDAKSGSGEKGEKGEKKSGSESSGGENKPAASSDSKSSSTPSPASDKK
jgi:putative FmdB family regulatory protein